MEKVVAKHFNHLFDVKIRKWEETNFTQNNQIEDINLNWEEGIRNLSQGKAWGLGGVPSEIFKLKNKELQIQFNEKINQTFIKYIMNNQTPKYFLTARFVLLSKDNTHYPKLNEQDQSAFYPQSQKLSN